MTAREDYTTKVRVRLDLTTGEGESVDEMIDAALNAAHDAVDRTCHRSFTLGAVGTFELVAHHVSDRIPTPDLAAVPTLVEVRDDPSQAWAALTATDWAPEQPVSDRPISALLRRDDTWPLDIAATVRVTAPPGWASVPASVEQATRLLTVRYVTRPKYKVQHADTTGEMMRTDPDVRYLLRPYVRSWA